ncbi:hypothetical protein [Acidicapsa acidisoli]|uniref:hypothetical protein n=1 Tax=Acidicapsa acidisoli TaxID=1615681 RepID=UPI0021E0E0AC|nr:hypothetical protein [Acidicapsa acidisoli]
MKQFGWILILLMAATSAWSAGSKKISVQELKDLLTSLQAAKKSDEDVALQLKQVELTEELTFSTMNSLSDQLPGPLSTEQMYVLEARSSVLPPPASDLPTAPAPDAAAQQAMLAKAADFATKTYPQLPHLTATKLTGRFQDGVEAIHTTSGMHSHVDDNSDPLWEQTRLYVRLLGTHTDTIESENGVEKIPAAKEKAQWGPNGQVASVGPALTLNTVVQEASANGSPKFLRWEKINDKQVAVYSFAIDKKKTHFGVNYCCFPDTDTAGVLNFSKNGGQTAGGGSSAKGNLQTVSDWKNFKANVGYHGEIFIDPDSGIVVRTITEADFKPTDFVHSEKIRTDYTSMPVGDKSLVVPVRTFAIAEVVPNGDSFAAHYSVRHQMVTQDYKDYQLAGATTAQK